MQHAPPAVVPPRARRPRPSSPCWGQHPSSPRRSSDSEKPTCGGLAERRPCVHALAQPALELHLPRNAGCVMPWRRRTSLTCHLHRDLYLPVPDADLCVHPRWRLKRRLPPHSAWESMLAGPADLERRDNESRYMYQHFLLSPPPLSFVYLL